MVCEQNYQAVIVGASVAGCAAALELAQAGIRVALVEVRPSLEDYKPMCTHLIHSAGVAWLKRHRLYDGLLVQGGQETYLDIAMSKWRFFYPFRQQTALANIERRYLDPALKERVSHTQNISAYWGYRVSELIRENGRITGVVAFDKQGHRLALRAPCVIAADGRNSKLAALDDNASKKINSHRVAVFAYFENPVAQVACKIWARNRGEYLISYLPNGKRAIVSAYLGESRYARVKDRLPEFFAEEVLGEVAAHGIQLGVQCSKRMVAKDTSTRFRTLATPGLVYVGDAALSVDPLTGIGCTWAMTSAALLSAQIASVLRHASLENGESLKALDRRIRRYYRLHWLKFRVPAYGLANLSAFPAKYS